MSSPNYVPLVISSIPREVAMYRVTTVAYKNWIRQRFSLPYLLIDYISKTSDHRIYEKLIESCKYFQAKEKKVLIQSLTLSTYSNKGFVINTAMNSDELDKLWITESFDCVNNDNEEQTFNDSISRFFPKIFKVDARNIHLRAVILTLKEFNFIINPDTVEQIEIFYSFIEKPDGSDLTVEEMVEMVPKAERFK